MKAILVSRVSTAKQADGLSPDLQQTNMRIFVESSGGEVVGVFHDSVSGTSAKYEHRKGIQAALQLIEEDCADTLVVYNVSRASRDNEVFRRLLRDVYDRGGRFAVASEGTVYRSIRDARKRLHWLGAVAEWEHLDIYERTQPAKVEALKRGTYGWKAPLGYRHHRQDKKSVLVPDETYVPVIRAVFTRLAAGDSKGDVVRMTHDQGFGFNTSNITKMVERADIYAGGTKEWTIRIDGEDHRIEYKFPQIVDSALAAKVKRIAPTAKRKPGAPTPYLSIVRCQVCGNTATVLRRYKERGESQLVCTSYFKDKARRSRGRTVVETHQYHSVYTGAIDKRVRDFLAKDSRSYVETRSGLFNAVVTAHARVKVLEQAYEDIEIVMGGYEVQLDDLAKYKHALARIDKKLGELGAQAKALQPTLAEARRDYERLSATYKSLEEVDWDLEAARAKKAISIGDWATANRVLAALGVTVFVDFTRARASNHITIGYQVSED